MILFVVLLLGSSSFIEAKEKDAVETIKFLVDKGKSLFDLYSSFTGILEIFQEPESEKLNLKLDEVLSSIDKVSNKIDNLEFVIQDFAKDIESKITENYINTHVTKANEHRLKIEENFKDMKSYSIGLSKFENSTLLEFSEKDITESLREYHQQYFINKGVTGGTFFEQIGEFLRNRGDVEKTCLNEGVDVQRQLIDYYQSIVATRMKAVFAINFKYYLKTSYFQSGNFKNERNQTNFKITKWNSEMESDFKKVLLSVERNYWHCYTNNITNYTSLIRVAQSYILIVQEFGRGRFSYVRNECKGDSYDWQSFHEAPMGFGFAAAIHTSHKWTVCKYDRDASRRYHWILDRNGGIMGKRFECSADHKETEESKHPTKLALCDDENDPHTERRFSTEPVSSDVTQNFVITGIRIRKSQKTIHFEVQQGQLLPYGNINSSSVSWKSSKDNFKNSFPVNHNTTVHITDNYDSDGSFALTQIKFAASNNELYLELRLTKFNYSSGILLKESKTLAAKKSGLNQIPMDDLDEPIYGTKKHSIKNNGFLKFSASSRSKDAAQSTIPYIDTGDVSINKGSILSGAGLHYKQSDGYGGFIGLNVKLYDHNKNINLLI